MLARTIRWLLIAIGVTMCGCQYAEYHYAQPAVERRAERDVAAFNDAVARVAELHYEDAAATFTRLIDRFEAAGDTPRAAEAMFWLAYCREKQGQLAEAAELYERLIGACPNTPASHQARQRLSRLPVEPGD